MSGPASPVRGKSPDGDRPLSEVANGGGGGGTYAAFGRTVGHETGKHSRDPFGHLANGWSVARRVRQPCARQGGEIRLMGEGGWRCAHT